MAELCGELWEWNLTKVVVVDVTDDYRFMLAPMPGEFYPVLGEIWLPTHKLTTALQRDDLVKGYLYDWHETASETVGQWYLGVVNEEWMRGANVPTQPKVRWAEELAH